MLSEEDIATLKYYGDNYKNISPKCPVLIPSYKNREDSRIRHLETVSDNKIMIFVWDWDYKESGYDKIQGDNIEYVLVPKQDWRCVQRTRVWMCNYMKEHYPEIDHYLMIDDDVGDGRMTNYTDTRKPGNLTMHVPLKNLLGILEDLHVNHSYHTVSAFDLVGFALGNPGELSSSTARGYQAFCIQNGLQPWRDVANCSEDNLIWYDFQKQGVKYNIFKPFKIEFNTKIKTTISDELTQVRNWIYNIRVMKSACTIRPSGYGWVCNVGFNLKKENNNPQWPLTKAMLDKYFTNWEDLDNELYMDKEILTNIAKDMKHIADLELEKKKNSKKNKQKQKEYNKFIKSELNEFFE